MLHYNGNFISKYIIFLMLQYKNSDEMRFDGGYDILV